MSASTDGATLANNGEMDEDAFWTSLASIYNSANLPPSEELSSLDDLLAKFSKVEQNLNGAAAEPHQKSTPAESNAWEQFAQLLHHVCYLCDKKPNLLFPTEDRAEMQQRANHFRRLTTLCMTGALSLRSALAKAGVRAIFALLFRFTDHFPFALDASIPQLLRLGNCQDKKFISNEVLGDLQTLCGKQWSSATQLRLLHLLHTFVEEGRKKNAPLGPVSTVALVLVRNMTSNGFLQDDVLMNILLPLACAFLLNRNPQSRKHGREMVELQARYFIAQGSETEKHASRAQKFRCMIASYTEHCVNGAATRTALLAAAKPILGDSSVLPPRRAIPFPGLKNYEPPELVTKSGVLRPAVLQTRSAVTSTKLNHSLARCSDSVRSIRSSESMRCSDSVKSCDGTNKEKDVKLARLAETTTAHPRERFETKDGSDYGQHSLRRRGSPLSRLGSSCSSTASLDRSRGYISPVSKTTWLTPRSQHSDFPDESCARGLRDGSSLTRIRPSGSGINRSHTNLPAHHPMSSGGSFNKARRPPHMRTRSSSKGRRTSVEVTDKRLKSPALNTCYRSFESNAVKSNIKKQVCTKTPLKTSLSALACVTPISRRSDDTPKRTVHSENNLIHSETRFRHCERGYAHSGERLAEGLAGRAHVEAQLRHFIGTLSNEEGSRRATSPKPVEQRKLEPGKTVGSTAHMSIASSRIARWPENSEVETSSRLKIPVRPNFMRTRSYPSRSEVSSDALLGKPKLDAAAPHEFGAVRLYIRNLGAPPLPRLERTMN